MVAGHFVHDPHAGRLLYYGGTIAGRGLAGELWALDAAGWRLRDGSP